MPLPALAVLGIGLVGIVTTGSVSVMAVKYNKGAKTKLRCIPTGIPRAPPGMTRGDLKRAADRLQMNITKYYNFAFCGGSGSGKSTLINALRNRDDIDIVEGNTHDMYGSAPTGEWQTTMSTFCYAYPEGHDLQYMRLWDTAGLGTHEHPSANFFKDKCLYAFDVLMVVAEKELGEYEYALLENAEKQKTPAVIVITKAEEKVSSKIHKLFNTRNPPLADYMQIVKETTNEARLRVFTSLEKRGLQKTPVFIVSAWKYREFMIEEEDLEDIGHQETTPNSEVSEDEPLGQEVFYQADNIDTLANHEDQPQEIVEDDPRGKTALLAFELNHLLDYIAGVAVYRRL